MAWLPAEEFEVRRLSEWPAGSVVFDPQVDSNAELWLVVDLPTANTPRKHIFSLKNDASTFGGVLVVDSAKTFVGFTPELSVEVDFGDVVHDCSLPHQRGAIRCGRFSGLRIVGMADWDKPASRNPVRFLPKSFTADGAQSDDQAIWLMHWRLIMHRGNKRTVIAQTPID